jgi:diaminopimelate decarboxylase
MNHILPKLTPITSKWMHTILEDFKLQDDLLKTYSSPLNIHSLPFFEDNIKEYQEVLNSYNFKSQLFFARKANKFKNLIETAVNTGIGVDTASYEELKQCLDLQVESSRLISTAAIKNKGLLELALNNNVVIIVDNKDELNEIEKLTKSLGCVAQIGIRVSGFSYEGSKLFSRFGFDIDEVKSVINENIKDNSSFNLKGFHFHLDGYSTSQRGNALHQTITLFETYKSHFPNLSFIDVGGGILMNYLESEDEWQTFQDQLKQALLENRPELTYKNSGLGFSVRDGVVEGKLATYPYFNSTTKANFLGEVLETLNTENIPVYKRLSDNEIELRLEPGRSLLNQVGITMARVAHRKIDARGNHLIGLEMNMSQLKSSSADFLLDPFVSYKEDDASQNPIDAYFTGAYCLEHDIILKRKVTLKQLPSIGDVVIFVNTAGYMMHFYETEAHLFKQAQNVSLSEVKGTYNLKDFKA